MTAQERAKKLKREGYSIEEIQAILKREFGRTYSLDTLKVYARSKMDLEKDELIMNRWREEYKEESEENSKLDEMYSLARSRGMIE